MERLESGFCVQGASRWASLVEKGGLSIALVLAVIIPKEPSCRGDLGEGKWRNPKTL